MNLGRTTMMFAGLQPSCPDQCASLPEAACALLRACGADQAAHSGRTLLLHLQGTHKLLQTWGNPASVCLAGLFHSIYGTNAFRRRSLGPHERGQLRAVIGTDAEALAWIFCGVERPRSILHALQRGMPSAAVSMTHRSEPTGREPMLVSPAQVRALAEIECANLIEQESDSTALRDLYCVAISHPGVVSAAALVALRQYLSRRLSRPATVALEPAS